VRILKPSRTAFPRITRTTRISIQTAAGPADAVDQLSDEIKVFERERDEATRTAETLAKTSVKLLEMTELLDKLALEKVADGDDDAARKILLEKEEVSLMLEKTKTRAENNFALAAKLAEAIGQKQNELVSLLPSAARPEFEVRSTPSYTLPASTSSFGSDESAGRGGYAYKAKWESSLEEARARIRSVEQTADTSARLGAYAAEDSISAALSRIEQSKQDIMVHRERIRQTAELSIMEARDRLKRQEEEALEEIKWLMRRYRNGEYIPDYLLDSAFDKLNRRMYK